MTDSAVIYQDASGARLQTAAGTAFAATDYASRYLRILRHVINQSPFDTFSAGEKVGSVNPDDDEYFKVYVKTLWFADAVAAGSVLPITIAKPDGGILETTISVLPGLMFLPFKLLQIREGTVFDSSTIINITYSSGNDQNVQL